VPFLSPAKVMVILVVALVVLGPDKLPKMAKQIGGLWGDFRKFRERLESDVRGSFPDLPSTEKISQAVRSPLSFLDTLADAHTGEQPGPSASANGSEHSGMHADPPGFSTDPTGGVRTDAAGRPSLVPGGLIPDAGGIVHQVRSTGGVVPDDPGLN